MLKPGERALLLAYCNGHPIAACPRCSEDLTFDRVGADVILGRRDFCPMCRADLTVALRQHLAECTMLLVQERESRVRSLQLIRHRSPNEPGDSPASVHGGPGMRDDAAHPVD